MSRKRTCDVVEVDQDEQTTCFYDHKKGVSSCMGAAQRRLVTLLNYYRAHIPDDVSTY